MWSRVFFGLVILFSLSLCSKRADKDGPGLKRLRADMRSMIVLLERGDQESTKEFLQSFVNLSRMSRRATGFDIEAYAQRFRTEGRERYLKDLKAILPNEPANQVGTRSYSFNLPRTVLPEKLKRLVGKAGQARHRKVIRGKKLRFQWDPKRARYVISPR